MTLRTAWRAAERRLRRMMAVARIETLRLTRDRVAISLIALVPAVQIVLFGYAVNLDPKNVPIAIAGSDATSVERAARIVGETGYFKIIGEALPSGAAERMVVAGQALVGIELPPSPDEEEAGGTPMRARVVVDATDPGAVRPALAALETAYWQKRATTFSLDDRPSVDVDWLYNPQRRTAWTIVPGLVGVIVMISMLMLGALTLVRERERGSWEALLATPVDALDALVGKLSPYIVIGTAQGAVAVGLAQLLFDSAGERRPLGAAGRSAGLCDRQSDPGLRLLRSGGKPDAGDAGCRLLLSAVDAAVGLHVPLPGNAGLGAGDRRGVAADPLCPRRARSFIEGSRRRPRRPGDVAGRSLRVSGGCPRPCRIPPPH